MHLFAQGQVFSLSLLLFLSFMRVLHFPHIFRRFCLLSSDVSLCFSSLSPLIMFNHALSLSDEVFPSSSDSLTLYCNLPHLFPCSFLSESFTCSVTFFSSIRSCLILFLHPLFLHSDVWINTPPDLPLVFDQQSTRTHTHPDTHTHTHLYTYCSMEVFHIILTI